MTDQESMTDGEGSSRRRARPSVFPPWYQQIKTYQRPSVPKAMLQLANSLLPYFGFWALMLVFIRGGFPYWSVLLLVIPTAFFLVRTFIIFHDCCHGSFLPGSRANRIVGYLTGVLTFTPYASWRNDHLRHHATNGQLDHRGFGDVWTMTLEEYASESRRKRLQYRLYRNPFVMFLLGPLFTFVIHNRLVDPKATKRERRSTHATNIGLAVAAAVMSLLFGPLTYLAIQLPVILFAGTIGIWLFYIQHQFDPGYWARDAEWNQYEAAMTGASYYRLPSLLRWLTGNIGIHHIHHLRPGIPNYNLWAAYRSTPEAQAVSSVGFLDGLRSIRYNLWHEANRKFLSFREAHRLLRASPA